MLDLNFVRKVARKVYSGEFNEAETMVALAGQSDSSPLHRSQCRRVMAECLIERGELTRAREELQTALQGAGSHVAEQTSICADFLALAHLMGDLSLAEEMERAWIALERFGADEPHVASLRGRTSLSRGYLSLLRGELHAAASWFWAAVQFYLRPNAHPREGMDRSTLLPLSYCLDGHVMLKLNRPGQAAQDLALAGDWITEGSYLWNYYIALQAEHHLAGGRVPEALGWTLRGTAGGLSDGQARLEIARARIAHARGERDAAGEHLRQAEGFLWPAYRGYLRAEIEEARTAFLL